MPKEQSNLYKTVENVDRVNDIVGSDVTRDILKVALSEQDLDVVTVDLVNETDRKVGEVTVTDGSIDITDRSGRNLGSVTVDSIQSVVDVAGDVEVTNQIETALDAALASSGSDSISVELASGTVTIDHTEDRNLLAHKDPIDGGVVQEIPSPRNSLYLDVAAAVDVTIELSPDGGITWFEEPTQGTVSFGAADSTVINLDFQASHIRITGSNTTDVSAWLVSR